MIFVSYTQILLGAIQKLHKGKRGRGSTILLCIVTYIKGEEGYFWSYYVTADTKFERLRNIF